MTAPGTENIIAKSLTNIQPTARITMELESQVQVRGREREIKTIINKHFHSVHCKNPDLQFNRAQGELFLS
jgi:hypothetical protein